MSGFAPYGYRKDPTDRHRFLIDDAAAEAVQEHLYSILSGRRIRYKR